MLIYSMVRSHTERMNFDNVFISEKYKSYKGSNEGRIFDIVINHYKSEKDEILHIGDSTSDIKGSNGKGIDSCWINRNGRTWESEILPTFEIKNLRELYDVLSI